MKEAGLARGRRRTAMPTGRPEPGWPLRVEPSWPGPSATLPPTPPVSRGQQALLEGV